MKESHWSFIDIPQAFGSWRFQSYFTVGHAPPPVTKPKSSSTWESCSEMAETAVGLSSLDGCSLRCQRFEHGLVKNTSTCFWLAIESPCRPVHWRFQKGQLPPMETFTSSYQKPRAFYRKLHQSRNMWHIHIHSPNTRFVKAVSSGATVEATSCGSMDHRIIRSSRPEQEYQQSKFELLLNLTER